MNCRSEGMLVGLLDSWTQFQGSHCFTIPHHHHHHFRCQSQAQILTYASNQLAEAQRFPRPLPRID